MRDSMKDDCPHLNALSIAQCLRRGAVREVGMQAQHRRARAPVVEAVDSIHGELAGAPAALKQVHALAGPGIDLILQGYIAGRAARRSPEVAGMCAEKF